jgi:4-oxalocrotonate tautomerase
LTCSDYIENIGRSNDQLVHKEAAMPLVNVRLIEGVFDESEKEQMIGKLTDAMVEIEGESMRGVTWVVIDEVKSGDWGMGGQSVTAEHVRAIKNGVPA